MIYTNGQQLTAKIVIFPFARLLPKNLEPVKLQLQNLIMQNYHLYFKIRRVAKLTAFYLSPNIQRIIKTTS